MFYERLSLETRIKTQKNIVHDCPQESGKFLSATEVLRNATEMDLYQTVITLNDTITYKHNGNYDE